MMKFIQGTTFTLGVKLNLKIGVHYGPCIYGVIGYHKPQFSLIGDTVNTTSRHCTTGESGMIVLSMAAKEKIDLSLVPNSKTAFVEMKGKGLVEVFMILPPKKAAITLEHIRDVSISLQDVTSQKPNLQWSITKRRATVDLSHNVVDHHQRVLVTSLANSPINANGNTALEKPLVFNLSASPISKHSPVC